MNRRESLQKEVRAIFPSKRNKARRARASRLLMVLMSVCVTTYLLGGGFATPRSVQAKIYQLAQNPPSPPGNPRIIPGRAQGSDPWAVVLYEHRNYRGRYIKYGMEPGRMRHKTVVRLPPEFEDKVSSIKVGSMVKVVVFKHRYLGNNGPSFSWPFEESVASLGLDDDTASSLVVFPKELMDPLGAYLWDTSLGKAFNHATFFPLPELESMMETGVENWALGGHNLDEDANFLGITHENVEVTLYDQLNFKGASITFPGANSGVPWMKGSTGSKINLHDHGWADRARSLKVRWKGNGRWPFSAPSMREKAKAPPAPPAVREKVTAPPAPKVNIHPAQQPQTAPVISGKWNSNIGAIYEITQTGDQFTWSAPSLNQQGNGTVSGKAVIASIGTVSIKGAITELDATGQPTRIEWENGVVIFRAKGQPEPGPQPIPAVNVSGQWNSNIGAIYEITQSGDQFTWSAPSINQKGTGTVQGKAIVAYLDNGPAPFKGNITRVDANGRATRIEWENGVALFRQ